MTQRSWGQRSRSLLLYSNFSQLHKNNMTFFSCVKKILGKGKGKGGRRKGGMGKGEGRESLWKEGGKVKVKGGREREKEMEEEKGKRRVKGGKERERRGGKGKEGGGKTKVNGVRGREKDRERREGEGTQCNCAVSFYEKNSATYHIEIKSISAVSKLTDMLESIGWVNGGEWK